MKANELRIGNLIFTGDDNMVFKVQHGTIRGVLYNHLNVKPIPLTEEWLLKFGFNEITHRGIRSFLIQSLRADLLYQPYTERVFSFSEVDGNTWCLRTVREVHTLQNLFYSLTGEELESTQNKC
jgi:hypothetical protein